MLVSPWRSNPEDRRKTEDYSLHTIIHYPLFLISHHSRHLHDMIPTPTNRQSFPSRHCDASQSCSQLSACISGLTVPTDFILPSCPMTLLLLYFPDPFPTESRLSQVQCSVLLVVPEFRTLFLFDYLPFPTFSYHPPSVFTFAPLSYSLFLFTTLPSHSDLCSTYSSSQYFVHFLCGHPHLD